MVFAGSYKKKKTIIGNCVRRNASYERYRASREVTSITDTRGADVEAPAVHDRAPAAAEAPGEEVPVADVLLRGGGAPGPAAEEAHGEVRLAVQGEKAGAASPTSTLLLLRGGGTPGPVADEAHGEAGPEARGEEAGAAPTTSTLLLLHGGGAPGPAADEAHGEAGLEAQGEEAGAAPSTSTPVLLRGGLLRGGGAPEPAAEEGHGEDSSTLVLLRGVASVPAPEVGHGEKATAYHNDKINRLLARVEHLKASRGLLIAKHTKRTDVAKVDAVVNAFDTLSI